MALDLPHSSLLEPHLSRRAVLHTATVATLTLVLPRLSSASTPLLKKPVQIGVIADLHHDVMHDGIDRLGVFLKAMEVSKPDAILQLGDFAYPSPENSDIITLFNQANHRPLHVIGNHDTDA
ncbi:MAG: metallophosphoesterase, partial [Phycisphaerae bacterium]|nr:metallophosphoesterase [Phycisphaerae bacterium]